jgi:peptide/nickel transport system substrate-binding protein
LRVLDRHPLPGFGPFVEKEKGTFARNPNYWRKAANGSSLPYLDAIVLTDGRPGQHDFAETPVPADDYEALKKIEQGVKARLFELGPGLDADALWLKPASGAESAKADLSRRSSEGAKAEGAKADLSRRSAAGAKADRPWLTSEALRLAISTAVDRREYCRQVFFGACDPTVGPVTPANASWFNPDLPLGRPDPQLARAMLAELGLRDRGGDGMLSDATLRPVRFSLLIRNDLPSSTRAATFIANTLKGIGILVDITPVPAHVLEARRLKGNYDAIYDRIAMDDTDPAMNLDFWLSSGTAHLWHGARSGPPADWERQIDQLMMKTTSTFDRVERLQAFVDAQKLYYQHMPAVFFGAPYVRIMTSIRTLNATPSPLRPYLLWNAEALAALK